LWLLPDVCCIGIFCAFTLSLYFLPTVLLLIDFVVKLLFSYYKMSKDVYEHENEKKTAGSVDTGKIFAL